MKTKKLPPAKVPLPKFSSDEETADYLEKHSVAEIWDKLPKSNPQKLSKALESAIRERRSGR